MKSISKSIPLLFAQLIQKFILLLISSRLSSSIGISAYGNFAYARSYINFIDTTISSSLFPILIKEIQQFANSRPPLKAFIKKSLFVYILVALISFILLFTRASFTTIESILLVTLSALILIYGLLQAVSCAYKQYSLILKGTFISATIAIALCVFLGFSINLKWALLCLCIFYASEIASRAYGISKDERSKRSTPEDRQDKPKTEIKKSSLVYSLLASLTNAFQFLLYRDYLANRENGLETLGNIDIGYQLVAVSFMALNALSLVQYNTLNRKQSNKDSKKHLTRALVVQFATSIALSLFTLTLGKFYYSTFFHTAEIGYLYTLTAAIPAYSVALTLNRYIVHLRKEHILLYGALFGGFSGFIPLQLQMLPNFTIGYFFAIYYTSISIILSIIVFKNLNSLKPR